MRSASGRATPELLAVRTSVSDGFEQNLHRPVTLTGTPWRHDWATPRRMLPQCDAATRRGTRCLMRVVPGKSKCRMHGGLSTGPRTAEGRAAIAESNRRRARPIRTA